MLAEYVQKQGWEIVDTYIDDGFSGTNFDRPGFQRMIADIEKGRINLVITKDLSRLGRNYIMCGQYTEIYFPERHVRYIALNDGVDTLNQTSSMDITPFKHILNDMYAKIFPRKSSLRFIPKQSAASILAHSTPTATCGILTISTN
ncbi:recombinase family protein [Enterococcus faecium]|uniref:recombinase family protein n=1 Tax=Enterococcus faecium TaxID=1352 RepID=UPI00211A3926|nr:recombinase family protein [Enterococcus faecium]